MQEGALKIAGKTLMPTELPNVAAPGSEKNSFPQLFEFAGLSCFST